MPNKRPCLDCPVVGDEDAEVDGTSDVVDEKLFFISFTIRSALS